MNLVNYVTPEQLTRVVEFLNKHQVGGGVWASREDHMIGFSVVPQIEGKMYAIIALNRVNPLQDAADEFDNHVQVVAGQVNRRLELWGEETIGKQMQYML